MYLIPIIIPIIIAFISSYIFVGWVLCSTAFEFYRWKIPVTTIWLAVVIVCFVAWVKLMGVTFSMPATVSFAAVFIVCWVAFFWSEVKT